MPTFRYSGVSRSGKDVKGVKEGMSKQSITSELLSEGIYVTEITDAGQSKTRFEGFASFFSPKINLADTFFQLSLLLRSGIPLVEGLKIIARTTKQQKLKQAILESAAKVSEGMRFSEALSKYPNMFDSMYVNLIRASEQVGRLSAILGDIANYEEDKRKNTDKISSAIIYPVTILILGMGVLGFMLAFVVPKMEDIFKTMKHDIPVATKFLLSLSRFVSSYGLILLFFVLFVIFLLRYLYRNHQKFRIAVDKRLFQMNLVSSVSVAKFAHVLAFQLKEGLPLTDALHYASMTVNNVYMREEVAKIRSAVQAGTRLSAAVKNAAMFPDLFPAAVSTGESSGNMPELLERVNEFYSKQVDKFLANLLSVIEPLFIIIIGLLVGFIVVSIMMPLFNMNNMIG